MKSALCVVVFPDIGTTKNTLGLKTLQVFHNKKWLGLLVVMKNITNYVHHFHDVEYTVTLSDN